MIAPATGNLLESDAEAVVNTVNCVGVMGKGIALQFKQAYPELLPAYEQQCEEGRLMPGHVQVLSTNRVVGPRFVINFPTKRHWKDKSKLADIESGLKSLVEAVRAHTITRIALPPLGCGNGGLKWSEVQPLIVAAFAGLPAVEVLLYAPGAVPSAEQMPVATEATGLNRNRALLIALIARYGEPGYRLTMLEVQKLAYLLHTVLPLPRLIFAAHKYGPYADNLNFVFQRMEGHYTRGYGDRSRSATQLSLLPGAEDAAKTILATDAEAQAALDRVTALIDGFETPHSMELLATTHWVALHHADAAQAPSAARSRVHAWNPRKRQMFTEHHITVAWQRLHDQGWISEPQVIPR